jgi:hypothetical protein
MLVVFSGSDEDEDEGGRFAFGSIVRRTPYSATVYVVQKKIRQPVCLLERLLGSYDNETICCDSVRQSVRRIQPQSRWN